MEDPWMVLRVWEGGMASHGGFLGVAIYCWIYAKKHHVTWTGLGDGICVVAPIGLFFGRMANFINGELYGRVVEGLTWAVKFPRSLELCPQEVQAAAWQSCVKIEPSLADATSLEPLVVAARTNPQVAEALAAYLPDRHPSQLYEGFLEGALMFGMMIWLRYRFPKAPDGMLTSIFIASYALVRIVGEQFREPDSSMVGPFTKGQFLSLFMILFAIGFGVHAWRGWKRSLNASTE
jgi:phosphatidylglycerol:prolipoprotein diacylglycerol transferase